MTRVGFLSIPVRPGVRMTPTRFVLKLLAFAFFAVILSVSPPSKEFAPNPLTFNSSQTHCIPSLVCPKTPILQYFRVC